MCDHTGIRILVVDDENSVRRSLAGFLEDFGFDVSSAGSAEEALELLSGSPHEAAVVDLRLPEMSGDALILQAHKILPRMRFLIHTGSVTYRLPEELKRIGMEQEHVFLKPLADLTVIVDAIDTLLGRKDIPHDQ